MAAEEKRLINLKSLIEQYNLTGSEIKDQADQWLIIKEIRKVKDGWKGNDEYAQHVPEGETTYLVLNGNFYTEKGLRYIVLRRKHTDQLSPYHVTYPYVFKIEGKEVTLSELMGATVEHHEAVKDIWSL